MTQSAKVRITGHQRGLVLDCQGRSKAVHIIKLVLGLDVTSTERSLRRRLYQTDGQWMHGAHGCHRSVQAMFAKNPASRPAAQARVPTGQLITAEEVARNVAFLCDPENRHMTGATLLMDGGLSLVTPAKK